MGNSTLYDKYNLRGNVDISIKLDKVCYFPGEQLTGKILITPNFNLFEEAKRYCEIIISLTQHSSYVYQVGSDYETEEEIMPLMKHKFRFSDFIELDNQGIITLPISYLLPTYTRPSIFLNRTDYVKHFISVDYPHFNVKRTLLFAVKNHIKYHFQTRILRCPYNYQTVLNKKKFISNKGSCRFIINMPRNYFLYNEKIGYNIFLDCNTLQIEVKSIKISLLRKIKNNFRNNYLHIRNKKYETLLTKAYNTKKGEKTYNIVDYICFCDCPSLNKDYVPAISIYNWMDSHGLFEVDDDSLKNLLPSFPVGLISIDYFLHAEIEYDSIFTSDDRIDIPIEFCSIIYDNIQNTNNIQPNYPNDIPNNNMNNNINNSLNNNIYNSINNSMNQITTSSNNFRPNNSTNNFVNINEVDNINIIENENAPPPTIKTNNIDIKKNYAEDKKDIDLSDWVIINK